MVVNKYAFLQITRRRFLNEWEAFKKVISRRNIRRRITIPLTLSNLKLLRRITRTEDRKSGSAGMPRPISYAVFCLKKKNNITIASSIKIHTTNNSATYHIKFKVYPILLITIQLPPRSTLFPYTTLFRSWEAFKKVISRRNIRRRITIPLTLSNLKLLRRITRT